ncbi:hypothetical protein JRI60_00290 [Archangium violaceum]|uniref:hypothetical protein n=1 Tax=Archangium violaceum TaxID=83451 RepID=UPI00194EE810|nr:hypothetical protein [Archangium violaceum]QRN97569.1 hypothetical protein JRI60_00290 [Archangium violaceum]
MANESMPIPEKLAALHMSFTRASSVREVLRAQLKKVEGLPIETPDQQAVSAGEFLTGFQLMEVFYGLIFVVAEGIQAVRPEDPELASFFASPNMGLLKRYRNAIFHAQSEVISPKLHDFLTAEDTEKWIGALWRALNRWFSDNVVGPYHLHHTRIVESLRDEHGETEDFRHYAAFVSLMKRLPRPP